MHKVLNTWWCWHICKGGVVGVDLNQLEMKRRRKEQVLVGRGLENAPELVANAQPFLGVAPPFLMYTGQHRAVAPPPKGRCTTTLCTVHRHPCNVSISAAAPFHILGITLSFEL
jgi:hypothetical protein